MIESRIKAVRKISKKIVKNKRSYKGFNFFADDDIKLFTAILSGEFNIRGFQNRDLRKRLNGKKSSQISRIIKRLRTHGLIRKIANTYRYHLTRLGKTVITLGLKLKDIVVIPELNSFKNISPI